MSDCSYQIPCPLPFFDYSEDSGFGYYGWWQRKPLIHQLHAILVSGFFSLNQMLLFNLFKIDICWCWKQRMQRDNSTWKNSLLERRKDQEFSIKHTGYLHHTTKWDIIVDENGKFFYDAYPQTHFVLVLLLDWVLLYSGLEIFSHSKFPTFKLLAPFGNACKTGWTTKKGLTVYLLLFSCERVVCSSNRDGLKKAETFQLSVFQLHCSSGCAAIKYTIWWLWLEILYNCEWGCQPSGDSSS